MMTYPSGNEQYTLDDLQDVHEPVWASDSEIAQMQQVDDVFDEYPGNGDQPNVRVNGGLDFFDAVEESLEHVFGTVDPPAQKYSKLDAIATKEMGSDKWRGTTMTVRPQMSNPVLQESSCRRKVTIWNYGPALVYISASGNQGPTPNPNAIRVPISGAAFEAPRVLCTKDNVWCVEAAGGTGSVVEILEEFDMEY